MRVGSRSSGVRRLRRLARQPKARAAEGAYVLEGPNVLREALAARAAIDAVFAEPDAPADLVEAARAAGANVLLVEAGVLARAVDAVTPHPIAAIGWQQPAALDALADATHVLVCAGVGDPGNAGTIVRSAEASGADGVVFCDGSVDVYNPKTVRATAGSLFHVPVVAGGDAVAVLERLGGWGMTRLGAVATGGLPHTETDLRGPVAVVLGNEAHGLPAAAAPHLDGAISIPIAGRAESLNVAMAAAVLTFEIARQRRR